MHLIGCSFIRDWSLVFQKPGFSYILMHLNFQFVLLGAVPFPIDVPHLKELGVRGVITLNEPYETLVPTTLYHVSVLHIVVSARYYASRNILSGACVILVLSGCFWSLAETFWLLSGMRYIIDLETRVYWVLWPSCM